MSCQHVLSAEFLPSGQFTERVSAAIIHRMSGDKLVVAMCSGPYFDTAASAISARLAIGTSIDYLNAAKIAVTRRWNSLTDDEQWDQGWAGTACGIVLTFTTDSCSAAWLGDNHAFHFRNSRIIDRAVPHSVFEELQNRGTKNADSALRHVLTKWLATEHLADVRNWDLVDGDMILICSSYVDEELIRTWRPDRNSVHDLARQAGSRSPRLSHTVVGIHISNAEFQ